MYYILILGVILLDQVTKFLVRSSIQLDHTIPLIDGIFHLTYINNYGAAFSILEGKQFLLIGATLIAVIAVMIFIVWKRKLAHPMLLSGLALIAGGGIGNLIDRIWLGYVVDFFDFRIWPVFNVADIAVVSGCLLLLVYVLLVEGRE